MVVKGQKAAYYPCACIFAPVLILAMQDADNVFYHLTYEGAVDVASITDAVELKALETQVGTSKRVYKMAIRLQQPLIPVVNVTSSVC